MIMEYFEDLTALKIVCPHIDAFSPDGQKQYFRVIKGDEPTSECFLPTPPKPGKPQPDDCVCKSVSVFDDLEILKNAYFRIPAFKKKSENVAVLTLTEECGLLKQTFSPSHHSWWRSKKFNPKSAGVTKIRS